MVKMMDNEELINKEIDNTVSSLVKTILSIDDMSLSGEQLERVKYAHKKGIYRCMDKLRDVLLEVENRDDV